MPCQPSPSRSVEASWLCSPITKRVGALGLRGAAYRPRDVVVDVDRAEPPGHVGDVDPPAVQVERRPQPARDHGVRAVDHRRAQRGVGVVELGQRAVAHPALVAAVGAEAVERPAVVRRRAEPLVGVAGVVGGEVAEDPPAALVHGGRQPDVGRRRRRAAGRRGRTSRRCSGGCSRRGRPASCRRR